MKMLVILALSVNLLCLLSCNNSPTTGQTSATTTDENGASQTDSFKTIYLWGSKTAWPIPNVPWPLDSVPLDHAYATDFRPLNTCPIDSNYWYCLGATHPSDSTAPDSCYGKNAIGSVFGQGTGNVRFAARLVTPNYGHGQDCPENYGAPTGGLPWPYGAYGVCHQIANRAAYATYWKGPNSFGTPISLPKTFPGYRLTHFLYGTYGYQASQNFVSRIDSLGGNSSYVGDNGDSLEKQWLTDDFGKDTADAIWPEFQEVRKGLQVLVNASAIAEAPKCGQSIEASAQNAKNFNKKVSGLMNAKLLPVLGKSPAEQKRRFVKMFGYTPDKEFNLLDGSHVSK